MVTMKGFTLAAIASYGALLSTLIPYGLATPMSSSLGSVSLDGRNVSLIHTRAAEEFYLRVMPLGASITKGDPIAPGTGGRGYRKYIRDQLRFRGWKVNMVGSVRFGADFADNVSSRGHDSHFLLIPHTTDVYVGSRTY